ncbi:MAG: hypothetical protein ACUVX1_07860, partial [Chloroflexota bacterium]
RELLNAYARELKIATEVEVAEVRERARRESQAILAEAQAVRSRAYENAKRIESRLLTAEKRTRVILRELLSTADAAEATMADLDLDSKHYSVQSKPQPSSNPEGGQAHPPATTSTDSVSQPVAKEMDAGLLTDPEPTFREPVETSTNEERVQILSLLKEDGEGEDYAEGGQCFGVVSDGQDRSIEASLLEGEAPPAESSQLPSKPSHYNLFVYPVHGFSKIEELEELLAEIQGVEGVSLTSLESQGVVFEVLINTPQEEFLAGVASHVPDSRIVKVDQAEVELELVHSGGA